MEIEQYVLKEFVESNVMVNVTDMVEHILGDTRGGYATEFTCDMIENYIPNDDDDELKEIFSWYVVSDSLILALEDLNAVTIPRYNIWGRETFGQSIYMDSIIKEAYKLINNIE